MTASAGTVGVPVPLGAEGVVQAPLEPLGTVYLAGETWSGRTADGAPLARGTPVRLVGFDGLIAIVEPIALAGRRARRPSLRQRSPDPRRHRWSSSSRS